MIPNIVFLKLHFLAFVELFGLGILILWNRYRKEVKIIDQYPTYYRPIVVGFWIVFVLNSLLCMMGEYALDKQFILFV